MNNPATGTELRDFARHTGNFPPELSTEIVETGWQSCGTFTTPFHGNFFAMETV